MAPLRFFVTRDDSSSSTFTPTLRNLLIALVVLGFLALILAATMYILRQVRRRKQRMQRLNSVSELPIVECEQRSSRNSRRLTIATAASSKRESAFVSHEKEILMANSDSPPTSPIPEIRITFPEEVDGKGKRQSGRVVVVRVGDNGVGLEPVQENLPPYQQHEGDRFQSLDLDRIGGLKEKDMR